jgi:sigma-B regulation protein RsbU (phosphoserine phosphatase)
MAHRAFILPGFEKKMSTVDECVQIVGGNELRTEPRAFAGIEVLLIARPAGSDTGGDVYCLHSCGHGTLAKFVLLDLTGHGAERSAIARSLHEILHQYSEETSPARLLELVNRQYNPPAAPIILATAFVATFDPDDGVFRFSNAGQPRPLHWSAELRQWSVLLEAQRSDCGLPLGILKTACYDEEAVALSSGDILLLSSDALPETQNAAGEGVSASCGTVPWSAGI